MGRVFLSLPFYPKYSQFFKFLSTDLLKIINKYYIEINTCEEYGCKNFKDDEEKYCYYHNIQKVKEFMFF